VRVRDSVRPGQRFWFAGQSRLAGVCEQFCPGHSPLECCSHGVELVSQYQAHICRCSVLTARVKLARVTPLETVYEQQQGSQSLEQLAGTFDTRQLDPGQVPAPQKS